MKKRTWAPQYISGFGVRFSPSWNHERIREELRQKYSIWEGCKVRIMHRDMGHDGAEPKPYNVTVVAINKYHVTVRFPKGYNESMTWQDFEKELMVLL